MSHNNFFLQEWLKLDNLHYQKTHFRIETSFSEMQII